MPDPLRSRTGTAGRARGGGVPTARPAHHNVGRPIAGDGRDYQHMKKGQRSASTAAPAPYNEGVSLMGTTTGKTTAALRQVADLIDAGAPMPIGITTSPHTDIVEVQPENAADLVHWVVALGVHDPSWSTSPQHPERLFAIWEPGAFDGKAVHLRCCITFDEQVAA